MHEPGGQFQHRQFVVTKRGCLTVGARAMQTTYVVCLLHGSELAYILRPCGHYFQFLSECYDVELSNGEWLKVQNMEKSELFILI
jgi:hypothetical protein